MGESQAWEQYRKKRGLRPIPDDAELFRDGDAEDQRDARKIMASLSEDLKPAQQLALRRRLAEVKRWHERVKRIRLAQADDSFDTDVRDAEAGLTRVLEYMSDYVTLSGDPIFAPQVLIDARNQLRTMMHPRPTRRRGAPAQPYKQAALAKITATGFVVADDARTLLRAIGIKFTGPRVS